MERGSNDSPSKIESERHIPTVDSDSVNKATRCTQPAELFIDIMELGIADGLKELLIDYGFTCQKILRIHCS